MTIEQIRADLREVRYYYAMQHLFDANSKVIPPKRVKALVAKYNEAIEEAPGNVYILYVALYINNTTQIDLADDWGFSREYIKTMNRDLYEYLKNYFDKKGE